jgi:serine/threonine-protein kinase
MTTGTTGALSASHLTGLTTALADRYRLERALGAGGMATVWLAEDLRHGRRVAVKVLHPELSAVLGPERFLAEIRTTAGLQHPHILPLFDSGRAEGLLYYVMPFVDGETLRARLERERQLPVGDAVRIATEVADALQHAHERGIVHRDVKPENVLLQGGHALVADFGIALAVQQAGGQRMTQTGLSLGTPQYMSPEQAMGDKIVDARADVYALGAVTYEMLAGEPPFTGATLQAVVARVLTATPAPLTQTRSTVPAHVEQAVLTALAKLPADRQASTRDFATELAASARLAAAGPMHRPQPAAAPSRRLRVLVAALAVTSLTGLALAAWGWMRPTPAAPPATARFTVDLPKGAALSNVFAPLAITHDGRTVIFRATVNDTVRLVRRAVDRLDVVPIPGTEDAGWPSVSPDDQWLAFIVRDQIRKVSLAGGPATTVDSGAGSITWVTNELLVHASPQLRTIPVNGGAGRRIDAAVTAGGAEMRWPRAVGDGQSILFTRWMPTNVADARIGILSLATGRAKVLDVTGTTALGIVDGELLYVTAPGVLTAVPFDLASWTVTGAPRALLDGIDVNVGVGHARAVLAGGGTLAYITRIGEAAVRGTRLVTLERDGTSRELYATASASAPAWSPDGRRIAIEVTAFDGRRDVGTLDVATGAYQRLTSDGTSRTPSWSADGRRVLFGSRRDGRAGIWWQAADGSTSAEKLLDLGSGDHTVGTALSPDGRRLVLEGGDRGGRSLVVVDLAGDRRPRPLIAESGSETTPAISPDGQWVAYQATTGAGAQVYVRPFLRPGAATQVSLEGGELPVWSGDGRTLHYVAGTRLLMAATLSPGAVMAVTARRTVMASPNLMSDIRRRPGYAVSPDGKRVVGLARPAEDWKLVVVTDWLSEYRRARAARP